MNVENMNKKLRRMYEEHWDSLKSFKENNKLSSPLLMKVPECYTEQKTKLFVVGQQTDEWFEGNSVEELVDIYERFDFGKYCCKTPFWDSVRKLEKELEIKKGCIVWSNLNRMDDPKESDKCPKKKVEKDMAKKFGFLLREEINICRPDILVFFTGPNYDENIKWIFSKKKSEVEFKKLNNQFSIEERELAEVDKLNIDVETKAYRTYHPGYLFRNNNPERLGKKGEKIIQSILSDFKAE